MSKPLSPALVRQWHPTLNGVLHWQEISANSSMKIWWQCEKGHAWASSARNRTGGAGCPFCSGHRAWPGENDLQTLFPAIARQWHPTRNAPLTPDQIRAYSGKKIWWRCEKGHSWCTTPASRCSGTGCPYCSGRRVSAHNSLAAKNPQLAAQWHPQKNQGLCPTDVALHSRKKVWWQCENGHQWQATVSNRANGTGCPCCCGHTAAAGVNDLQTKYADLAAQWDPIKNGGLTPRQVLPGSSRVVWWRCAQGHSWQAPIRGRVKGTRCPYCSGRRVTAGKTDLAAVYPHLAEQWDLRENGMLQIQDVSLGSNQKVWWRCQKGHLWQASVRHRVGGWGYGLPGLLRQKRGAGL